MTSNIDLLVSKTQNNLRKNLATQKRALNITNRRCIEWSTLYRVAQKISHYQIIKKLC